VELNIPLIDSIRMYEKIVGSDHLNRPSYLLTRILALMTSNLFCAILCMHYLFCAIVCMHYMNTCMFMWQVDGKSIPV